MKDRKKKNEDEVTNQELINQVMHSIENESLSLSLFPSLEQKKSESEEKHEEVFRNLIQSLPNYNTKEQETNMDKREVIEVESEDEEAVLFNSLPSPVKEQHPESKVSEDKKDATLVEKNTIETPSKVDKNTKKKRSSILSTQDSLLLSRFALSPSLLKKEEPNPAVEDNSADESIAVIDNLLDFHKEEVDIAIHAESSSDSEDIAINDIQCGTTTGPPTDTVQNKSEERPVASLNESTTKPFDKQNSADDSNEDISISRLISSQMSQEDRPIESLEVKRPSEHSGMMDNEDISIDQLMSTIVVPAPEQTIKSSKPSKLHALNPVPAFDSNSKEETLVDVEMNGSSMARSDAEEQPDPSLTVSHVITESSAINSPSKHSSIQYLNSI